MAPFVSLLFQIHLIVFGLLAAFKLYLSATLGVCKSTNRLNGKTVIITGANTGIGKETAIDLAKRGAKVILACRDPKRATVAKDDIIALSRNKNVFVRQLDLASLQSVREFAAGILKSEKRLDILINNAGCALMERKLTDDGLEYQMQTNHFGHFLLTNLLLGLIEKTKGSRIINVSSVAHKWPKKLDLTDLSFERDPAIASKFMAIYGCTKLCNVLFTKELARRLKASGIENVTVNSLHPGAVQTEIFRYATFPAIVIKVINFFAAYFCKTAKEGAQTTIYLAVADEVADVTGEYFSDCKVAKTSELANNVDLAKKLWEVSETLVKLSPEETKRLN